MHLLLFYNYFYNHAIFLQTFLKNNFFFLFIYCRYITKPNSLTEHPLTTLKKNNLKENKKKQKIIMDAAKRVHIERAHNFMRQFRDPESRELKKLSANQFMEVWSHYDKDGE